MVDLEERIFEETYKEVLNERGNAGYMREIIKLGRDIMKKLGPDDSLIFLRYEMSVCLAYRIYIKKTYQHGLSDGNYQNISGIITQKHAQQNAQQNI